ncbi:MAG TPA: MotA/TolQ/ExbB proton channel family protein [Phycisphaerae bacterium]|nr:MotA/TolQ/ExbB proton channel family protein [Phycisphaerae bacterium]HUT56967.1 MotA/TolQ/ExbB proton channel family protein [Phycisphaerae bacterium]
MPRATILVFIAAALTVPAARLQARPTTQPGAAATVAATSQPAERPTASEEMQQQRREGYGENWLMQIFGWGMIPLWICSIVLVALVFERRKALRPAKVIDPGMVDKVADLVSELKVDEARELAAGSPTVLGKAWGRGFHEFQLGGMSLSEALTDSTLLVFKPLRRNLQGLATLGVIAPLLGLLGTILGMIIIFGQIAATGGADKSRLAGGIGLALFTTAGGLIIAIPAILSNRYFTARVTGFADQAEEAISRVNYRHSHAAAQARQEPAESPQPTSVAATK